MMQHMSQFWDAVVRAIAPVWPRRRRVREDDGPAAKALPSFLGQLLRMVARTQPVECTCGEAYHLLDRYAEAVAQGRDAAHLMPMVQHHLEICPDCREEFEILYDALQVLYWPSSTIEIAATGAKPAF